MKGQNVNIKRIFNLTYIYDGSTWSTYEGRWNVPKSHCKYMVLDPQHKKSFAVIMCLDVCLHSQLNLYRQRKKLLLRRFKSMLKESYKKHVN